jgi:hypothetical protein
VQKHSGMLLMFLTDFGKAIGQGDDIVVGDSNGTQ